MMFSAEMRAIQLKPQTQASSQVSLNSSTTVSARDPMLTAVILSGSSTVLKPIVVKTSCLHYFGCVHTYSSVRLFRLVRSLLT